MRRHNRLRALGIGLGTAALTTLSTTAAFAGPSYTYVGGSRIAYSGTHAAWVSEPITSTGGDFKVCVETRSTSNQAYRLYEYDPSNADDFVGTRWRTGSGCLEWHNVGDFVDGSDNRAEFYLHTADSKAWWVDYYD